MRKALVLKSVFSLSVVCFQNQMTAAAGNNFANKQWTFGQVVALTAFERVGNLFTLDGKK